MDRMYERCCGLGVQNACGRRRMPSFVETGSHGRSSCQVRKEVADPMLYGGMHICRRTANPVTDDGAQACIRRKRSDPHATSLQHLRVYLRWNLGRHLLPNVYGRLLRPLLALDYAQLPQKAAKHSVSSTPRRHLDPWRPYSQSSMTNLTPLFRRPEQRPEARARVDSFRARGRQS